jgi:hypothetical protein
VSAIRNALNAARYNWLGVRIGGPGASMQGLWPVLIVAVVFVFGVFFVVGRLLGGNGTPAEVSSAAPLTHAAIPGSLQGGSPIAGNVPNSITAPPPQPKSTPASGAAVLRATAPSETLETETETGSGSVASAPAAVQSEPATSGASAGSGSAGGANRGGGANGGGSFDSSE